MVKRRTKSAPKVVRADKPRVSRSASVVFVACGEDAGRRLSLPNPATAVLVPWTTPIAGTPHLIVLVGSSDEIRAVANNADFAPPHAARLVALPTKPARGVPAPYARPNGDTLPSILHGLSDPAHSEASTLLMFNQTLFIRVEPEPIVGDLSLIEHGAQTVLLSCVVAPSEPLLREAVARLCSSLDGLWPSPIARRLVLSWPNDGSWPVSAEPAASVAGVRFQDWARARGTPVALVTVDAGPQEAWSTTFDWSVIIADTHDAPPSELFNEAALDRLAQVEPAYRLCGSAPVSLCAQCWKLFLQENAANETCTFHPGPVCDYNSGRDVGYNWQRQMVPTTADFFDCCGRQVLGSTVPPGCTTGRHVAFVDSE